MRKTAFLTILLLAGSAFAQQPQPPASMYPAPPPERAPVVQEGAPLTGLSSPLEAGRTRVVRTEISSESEATLFAAANKVSWGRYAKLKGFKPGDVVVGQAQGLWTVKGRIEGTAPGSEGDWATIEGTVEKIAAGLVQIRGEVAFRVAKVQKGTPCKVGGLLSFRRSGKSQTWRLVEGDNPCDGAQEAFDLVFDKAADKRPVPVQQPSPQPQGKKS